MYEGMDAEDFLEHHGVKGMHWGVRKGQTGRVSTAARTLATKRTDLKIKSHEIARDNTGVAKVTTAIDRKTWGKNGKYEAHQNKKISELENTKAEIAKGKKVVSTLIAGPQYTKSKTPKKNIISDKDMADIKKGEEEFHSFLKEHGAYYVDILGRPKRDENGNIRYVK